MAGIARARPDAVIGVVLDGVTPRAAVGAILTVQTGAAAGRELLSLGGGEGVIVAAGGRRNMSVGFEDVVVGDTVHVDNRDYLAYAQLHASSERRLPRARRVPRRRPSGLPAARQATGSPDLYFVAPYEAAFDQKMIVVQNTHDAQCWPCATENLRRLITRGAGVMPICACGSPSTRCTSPRAACGTRGRGRCGARASSTTAGTCTRPCAT